MGLVYVYCGLCWLLMSYVLWDAFRRVRAAGWLKDKQAWHDLVGSMCGFVLAPLLAPIYAALALVDWICSWRDRRTARQLRKYREYLFDEVRPGELPEDVVAFLEEHTGPLESLPFRVIGDYWLWREPLPYIERELISADGRSFAAISIIEEVRQVAFLSVLSDGSYLETALALYDDPEQDVACEPPELQAELHTTGTVEELFGRHQERLDHAASEAFSYRPGDVRAVSIYGSRLVGQQLYAEGLRDELPPAPELPRPESQMELAQSLR